MKKNILGLLIALSVITQGCAYNDIAHQLKIVNNTEDPLYVGVGFTSLGFTLEPHQSIEFTATEAEFYTNKGRTWGEVVEDTTLELNESSYWLGEQEFPYWNERL